MTFIQSILELKPIGLLHTNETVQYAATFVSTYRVTSNGLRKIRHLFAGISNEHSAIRRALVNL
jgi:hypothetical protein